jgi:hypothetical protein
MGRRLEMPPACARCGKRDPQHGGYCKKCIGHATWLHAIQHAWEPAQVRIKGHLYDIRPEIPPDKRYPEPTGGKGFGGRSFTIRFFSDGRIVKTGNLWSIGPIPEEYREALPDNAEFVK